MKKINNGKKEVETSAKRVDRLYDFLLDNPDSHKEIKQSIKELEDVLAPIHDRLVKEGKVKIVDGKIIFLK